MEEHKKKAKKQKAVVQEVEEEPVLDEDEVFPERKAKKAKKAKREEPAEASVPEPEANDELNEENEESAPQPDKKKRKKEKNVDAPSSSASQQESASTEVVPAEPKNSIFSDETFDSLPINDKTKEALTKLGFVKMTLIQSKSIPECLAGSDLVGAAKTGSGKTLAFLIPIIELLNRVQFTRKQGTGAIVISPTRELSLQIYGVLRDIIEEAQYPQTHGLIMGGANRKAEADKLVKGVNILVATPGRLHDHLANTRGFNYQRLQMLVIDEADRILEQGFEEDMHNIIKYLPKERQTILFSATQTRKVEDLARLSMKTNPVYTGVHDDSRLATVEGLQQGYVVCPAEKRFMLLYSFLKKNRNKKVMVSFYSFLINFNSILFPQNAAGLDFF
jgi:ATP-dependent RNA helicase DDX18/HAS1